MYYTNEDAFHRHRKYFSKKDLQAPFALACGDGALAQSKKEQASSGVMDTLKRCSSADEFATRLTMRLRARLHLA